VAWFQKSVKQNKKYIDPHLRYLGPDSEQGGEIRRSQGRAW